MAIDENTPADDYSLTEKLEAIAAGLSPKQLRMLERWGGMRQVAQDALEEIERLQRSIQHG
jgi:hypothetical protein